MFWTKAHELPSMRAAGRGESVRLRHSQWVVWPPDFTLSIMI